MKQLVERRRLSGVRLSRSSSRGCPVRIDALTTLDPFQHERLSTADAFPNFDDPGKLFPVLSFPMPVIRKIRAIAKGNSRPRNMLTKLDRSRIDRLLCSLTRSLALCTSSGRRATLCRARNRSLCRKRSSHSQCLRVCFRKAVSCARAVTSSSASFHGQLRKGQTHLQASCHVSRVRKQAS